MKRIVIVGATSGIGLAVAEAYAAMGWRVGVAGRREEPMKQLKELFPQSVEWVKLDVNSADSPVRLLELVRRLGGMDVYLHCAGVWRPAPGLDATLDAETVMTNTVGFTRCIDTAYRFFEKMSARGHSGQLVAVTSVAGTKGIGVMAAYSASKRFQSVYLEAVDQLARSGGVKLRVTDIRPGWVDTPLLPERTEPYPMAMTLQRAVPLIVRAIKRHPCVAVIDRRWSTLVMLWRLLPSSLWVRLPYRP